MSLDRLQILRMPTHVTEKQLAFITRGSLLSRGTGKETFKFPVWHFCGDTLVKLIKVSCTASDKCN